MDGAALAAQFNALSCDHLEHLSDTGVKAMAAAGTVAVLLPGAFYFLRETQLPPVPRLRELGIPMAVASDHNPGSSPALSLLLMLHMACTLFRLTPEEALRGVTVQRRTRARPRRVARCAGRRPSRPTSWCGISIIPTSWPTGSAATRAGAWCAQGSSADGSGRGVHPAPRHDAAAGERAARRHRAARRPAPALRRARVRGRRHRLAPGHVVRFRARARRLVHRAALQPLPDRPQPPEGKRADVPRCQQHRAVPDALLHRRCAVPQRLRARRQRDRATREDLLAAVPRCACAASSIASTPSMATRCCSTATASSRSCRGCSRAACPTSTSAPPRAPAAHRACARR